MYKQMKADEYDCEVNNFEKRSDRCGELLHTKYAYIFVYDVERKSFLTPLLETR